MLAAWSRLIPIVPTAILPLLFCIHHCSSALFRCYIPVIVMYGAFRILLYIVSHVARILTSIVISAKVPFDALSTCGLGPGVTLHGIHIEDAPSALLLDALRPSCEAVTLFE